MKDVNYMQMPQTPERTKLNFGPPQSYEEALLRFPADPFSDNMVRFRQLLLQSPVLDKLPLSRRLIEVSKESVGLIEQWSFKRDWASGRETGWDYFLPYNRVAPFNDVFRAEELHREIKVWKLKPVAEDTTHILVCVEAKPGFVLPEPEYFLGFLKRAEFYLLVPLPSGLNP